MTLKLTHRGIDDDSDDNDDDVGGDDKHARTRRRRRRSRRMACTGCTMSAGTARVRTAHAARLANKEWRSRCACDVSVRVLCATSVLRRVCVSKFRTLECEMSDDVGLWTTPNAGGTRGTREVRVNDFGARKNVIVFGECALSRCRRRVRVRYASE